MFEDLLGKTLINIDVIRDSDDVIIFETTDNKQYKMFHQQDCCEYVSIKEIVGDISDLLGTPILLAEEIKSLSSEEDNINSRYDDSYTWTFYKLSTIKGSVTISWYGSSNGYYSETVDFELISND